MLRLVQVGYTEPFSFPVDPSAQFLPGQLAQLRILGSNNVVCGVSDGTAVIGIIDDIKTKAFTQNSINESVIAGPIPGVPGPNGKLVTPFDVKVELENSNIYPHTFVSNMIDVELIAKNGVVRFLAGTELNLDLDGDGYADSLKTIVSYVYAVPNVPGEDSTEGSKQVSVWFQRIIAQTDQYDTLQTYPLNAPLFCNHEGKFTSKQPSELHPVIALCIGPPSAINPMMEFILL